jgi:hypothetical protein
LVVGLQPADRRLTCVSNTSACYRQIVADALRRFAGEVGYSILNRSVGRHIYSVAMLHDPSIHAIEHIGADQQ